MPYDLARKADVASQLKDKSRCMFVYFFIKYSNRYKVFFVSKIIKVIKSKVASRVVWVV